MSQQRLFDVVVRICREYPQAANNDTILLERVWYAYGWNDEKSLYDNLSRVPRPESISRRRREAHEQGLIKYSEDAMKERMEAFKNERDHASDFVPGKAVSWLD